LKNLCIHVIKKQGLCALKNKIKNSLTINKNRKYIYIYIYIYVWPYNMGFWYGYVE